MVDIVDSAYKYYNIFGEHNKPSGSFTGNGSTEKRTIDTGGIGWAVAISSEQGNSLVFRNGAFALTSGGATHYPAATIQMQNGIIVMNLADSYFNKTGTTYYYQVL